MSDFIVKLDIELPQEVEHRIAGAIQAAVMLELGKVDFRGKGLSEVVFLPNKDWYGKWLRRMRDLKDVQAFERSTLVVTEQPSKG